MLRKVDIQLKFNNKRNIRLFTPCCNKLNRDGKFVNYKGHDDRYGYCHSCGKSSPPPQPYTDDKGEIYYWNEITDDWSQVPFKEKLTKYPLAPETNKKEIEYIDESIIWKYHNVKPENNLLQFLRKKHTSNHVKNTKEDYAIGSTKDGGTVFWMINLKQQVQKAKVVYYNENGKRTNRIIVPYKNDGGYYSCIFGEHLLYDSVKGKQTVILVESEKTAIVGAIMLPQYVWLAFGGLNGLTESKIQCLKGHKVLLIPDISEKAVVVACQKLQSLKAICETANVWDMTDGKTDEELKAMNIYNNDLEDYFRNIPNY